MKLLEITEIPVAPNVDFENDFRIYEFVKNMVEDKRFHGKAGKEYKLFKLACPHYDELQKTLAKEISTEVKDKNIKAIELGCGPGYTAHEVVEKVPNIKIISIDNEIEMIKQAEYILSDVIKQGKVELVHEDGLEYLKKQGENSFDIFFSAFTIHNFKQDYRKKVMEEIHRILKNNGLFVNADKYADNNKTKHLNNLNWQIKNYEVYDKEGRPDLKEVWTKHYIEDNKDDVLMIEDEAIEEMKKIGYIDIKKAFRDKMEAVIIARVQKIT